MVRLRSSVSTILLIVVALSAGPASADKEQELFTAAYEYLLSYRPQEAVDGFRKFLKEYPKSSARDAAIFWLGKTLIYLGSDDEASQQFSLLRKEFPQSPFVPHIADAEKEIASLRSSPLRIAVGAGQNEAVTSRSGEEAAVVLRRLEEEQRKTERLSAQISSYEKQRAAAEDSRQHVARLKSEQELLAAELASAKAERDTLKRVMAEKNAAALRQDEKSTTEPATTNAEQEALSLEIDRSRQEMAQLSSLLIAEKKRSDQLAAEVKVLRETEAGQRKELQERAVQARSSGIEIETLKKALASAGRDSKPEVTNQLNERIAELEQRLRMRENDLRILNSHLAHLVFEGKRAGREAASGAETKTRTPQTNDSAGIVVLVNRTASSVSALRKLGISDLPWRGTTPYDDYAAERALLREADRRQLSPDENRVKEAAKRFSLNSQEAEYFASLLRISALVDAEARTIAKGRAVDILSVEYRARVGEKAVLATELQTLARQGMDFSAIQKRYPKIVGYSRLTEQEFARRNPGKSGVLQKLDVMADTVVLFTEKGYSILKSVPLTLTFDPFSPQNGKDRDELRKIVRNLLGKTDPAD